MSWSTLPPAMRELAEEVCTPAQLDALKLWDAGGGYGRVGLMLGISKESARDRITRGLDRIRKAASTS